MDHYRISQQTLQAVIRVLEEVPARLSRHVLAVLEHEVNAQHQAAAAAAEQQPDGAPKESAQ